MNKLLVIACAVILFVGCTLYRRDVQLSVVNSSPATLTNVVAAGSGFSVSVGSLAPGAKQSIPLKSDTGGLKLEFDANGKHFSEGTGKNPWDGFKEIIMIVTTNFSVTVESVTTF